MGIFFYNLPAHKMCAHLNYLQYASFFVLYVQVPSHHQPLPLNQGGRNLHQILATYLMIKIAVDCLVGHKR